ncbi:hypothetical protein ABZ754_27430 [Micromonospora purpureochromogenes]|uniref:hypothetical protein n=1 Tax=Micromonospora purpureochromogenes TaxID=47872 RepID=UPI0033CAEEE8
MHDVLLAADVATAADWVGAGAAVVAAAGTVGTLVWQARALAQERETRRQEIARIEANQISDQEARARTIRLFDKRIIQSEVGLKSLAVTIANHGVDPITSISATAFHHWDESNSEAFSTSISSLPILPPGVEKSLSFPLADFPHLDPWKTRDAVLLYSIRVQANFCDLNGSIFTVHVNSAPVRLRQFHSTRVRKNRFLAMLNFKPRRRTSQWETVEVLPRRNK